MSLAQAVVNFQCLQRRLLGFRKLARWGDQTYYRPEAVAIRQSGIGEGITRVFFNGLLKKLDALGESLLGSLVPPIQTFQIILISLGARCIGLHHALFVCSRYAHA